MSPLFRAAAAALVGLWALPCPAQVSPGELLIAEMNCVACHEAAPPVKQRLFSRASPRLGEQGLRLTPQWLQAFLENPQATQPGTLMPDLLHGLAPEVKREAAADLTHYLLSLQKPDARPAAGVSSATIRAGEALYHTVGCVACHAPFVPPHGAADDEAAKQKLAELQKVSVPLGQLASKITVTELAGFLRDPVQYRPSGRMPACKLDEAEARAIAMYLLRDQAPAGQTTKLPGVAYEYYEANLPELPVFDRLTPKETGSSMSFSIEERKRDDDIAFRWRGSFTAAKAGEYQFFVESDDGSRLYVNDQLVVDNGGIHPTQERNAKVKLAAGAHTIRVEYFNAGGERSLKVSWRAPGAQKEVMAAPVLFHEGQAMRPKGEQPFTLEPARVERGRTLFTQYNCASCHQVDQPGKPAHALTALRARQPGGCLAQQPPAHVPKWELTDRQRVVLLAMLGNQDELKAPLTEEQTIRRTMTSLNCYACHQRDRRGGADGARREYFVSSGDVDLGDEGRIPPHLNDVGGKLKSSWVEQVLWKSAAVRPYMATRMPQFGKANVEHLVAAFEKADAGTVRPDPFHTTDEMLAKHGRKLVGTGGLTCIACHTFNGKASLGVPALDLATVGERLQPGWFAAYLKDPQALRPGTRMPSFWPGGVAANKEVLGGAADQQIEAIWKYLGQGKEADAPPGLIQSAQELIPEGEPIIYRHFIADVGPRAIGVGYPEKANLAFDADEMRLAQIWQGSFIDAARHRTGRGAGFEKPLGVNVVKFAKGAPFARLEGPETPWPKAVGAAAGYKFLGYRFDEKRRPVFMYRFGEVRIEDAPVAVAGEIDGNVVRTITLEAKEAPAKFYFRAAVDERIEKTPDGAYVVAKKVRMKFPGAEPLLRAAGDQKELLMPVEFKGGAAKIIQEITW